MNSLIETASADHIPGVLALIEGLSKRKPSAGYFIHVGGTGMLNEVPNGFGMPILSDLIDIVDSNLVHLRTTVRQGLPRHCRLGRNYVLPN